MAIAAIPETVSCVLSTGSPGERTCTFGPVAMHALQRVHGAGNARARDFLTGDFESHV
jgi:hypothetical protein